MRPRGTLVDEFAGAFDLVVSNPHIPDDVMEHLPDEVAQHGLAWRLREVPTAWTCIGAARAGLACC